MATLVTPITVFQRDVKPGSVFRLEFRLESWNPVVSAEEIRSRAGFAFDASQAHPTHSITSSERKALATLDLHERFETEVQV